MTTRIQNDVGRKGYGIMDNNKNRMPNNRAKGAGRLVVSGSLGRLLDADVPPPDVGLRGAGKMATLPCGVQLAYDRKGRYVGGRAPRQFSVASCPRLTLDAAADAIDAMAERISILERALVAVCGKVFASSDLPHDVVLVCRQVRQQTTEGDLDELDSHTSVGDLDGD